MSDQPSKPKTSTPSDSTLKPQPKPQPERLPNLRLRVDDGEPWKASQFSPFGAHAAVWALRRAVAEQQAVLQTLIDRINNCKGC